jgi:two-component SAPR family response regulator
MTGCGPETREGLLADAIARMDTAATEVGIITAKVNEAIKEAEKGKKLDLTDAAKAAEKLKETGIKIVEVKQRIDMARGTITEEEQREYAEKQKVSLNRAFKKLLEEKEGLRKALAVAETHDKLRVDELRKKITDAESPFEAHARQ